MKEHSHKAFRKSQSGMTLLEVVVSMLIIGLGLAMTLSMMQAGNRFGSLAAYRSTAMDEIQSIMDSMRANSLGAEGYIFGTATYDKSGYSTTVTPKTATPCTASTCTTKDKLESAAKGIAFARAHADMESWLGHVQTSLPGGQAAITKGADQNIYEITVMWHDSSVPDSESINMTISL